MAAHDHYCAARGKVGRGRGQLVAGGDEIVHALVGVGDALRDEEDELLVGGEVEQPPALHLVLLAEYACVDGVGDALYPLPPEQSAGVGLPGQPMRAGHEGDVEFLHEAVLLAPHLCREVVRAAAPWEVAAVGAGLLEVAAVEGEVANGRGGPDVVHGPHHRLAALQDLLYSFQGEHPLVDPMQVDDVGLAKLVGLGDVSSAVGDVHLEQVPLAEMEMAEDAPSLP